MCKLEWCDGEIPGRGRINHSQTTESILYAQNKWGLNHRYLTEWTGLQSQTPLSPGCSRRPHCQTVELTPWGHRNNFPLASHNPLLNPLIRTKGGKCSILLENRQLLDKLPWILVYALIRSGLIVITLVIQSYPIHLDRPLVAGYFYFNIDTSDTFDDPNQERFVCSVLLTWSFFLDFCASTMSKVAYRDKWFLSCMIYD